MSKRRLFQVGDRVRLRHRHPFAGQEATLSRKPERETLSGNEGFWCRVTLDDGREVAALLSELERRPSRLARQVDDALSALEW